MHLASDPGSVSTGETYPAHIGPRGVTGTGVEAAWSDRTSVTHVCPSPDAYEVRSCTPRPRPERPPVRGVCEWLPPDPEGGGTGPWERRKSSNSTGTGVLTPTRRTSPRMTPVGRRDLGTEDRKRRTGKPGPDGRKRSGPTDRVPEPGVSPPRGPWTGPNLLHFSEGVSPEKWGASRSPNRVPWRSPGHADVSDVRMLEDPRGRGPS